MQTYTYVTADWCGRSNETADSYEIGLVDAAILI